MMLLVMLNDKGYLMMAEVVGLEVNKLDCVPWYFHVEYVLELESWFDENLGTECVTWVFETECPLIHKAGNPDK